MNNSSCINVLKVIATAMVFFCHSNIVCQETFNYEVHDWYRLFVTPAWGGVWIFLIISGYLAAFSFYGGKYDLTLGGVINYYKGRIVKILIPTWVFITLELFLIYQNKMIGLGEVVSILTCANYGWDSDGISCPGVGASWYVFFVMCLYILTPLFIVLLNRLESLIKDYDFRFYLVILGAVVFLGAFYRIVTFFYLDWYRWTYANLLGCMDLFVAGLISFRMNHCLPNISIKLIKKLRYCATLLCSFLIVACLDFGSFFPPYGTLLYMYIWPSAYLILFCSLLVLFAYKTGIVKSSFSNKILGFTNILVPYSFAFYLWHSSVLMYVANHVKLVNDDSRFLVTILVGILVTSYISILMTKMNNGIISSLLKSR